MSEVNRRRFVQTGAAATAALLASKNIASAHERHDGHEKSHRERGQVGEVPAVVHKRLLIEPGLITDIDDADARAAWAALLSSELSADAILSLVTLDKDTVDLWLSSGAIPVAGDEPTRHFLNALDALTMAGGYPAIDASAVMTTGMFNAKEFEVTFDFFESDRKTNIDMSTRIPVIEAPSRGPLHVAPNETPYRYFDLFGWRVQFRPNHPAYQQHTLGTCAPFGSPHIHFDVYRSAGANRWSPVTTFHLGKYTQSGKRCFFMSTTPDQKVKYFCLKTCVPTFAELQRMFATAIVAAAAAVGIALAAWVVASMAYTLAAASFAVVVAL